MSQENNSNINDLIQALLLLKNEEEAQMFLRDLLTEKELSEFGKRWKAARMLSDSIPYSRIVQETGLSTATVARISKWLSEGMGGYRLMLERISSEDNDSSHLDHLHRIS